ncbi:MAG: serine hydrolase [Gammaproteobacteria bacterium]|nr:serine hydrolase [Gammaproteobacteria bacterium]
MIDRTRSVVALLGICLTVGSGAAREVDRAAALPAPDTSPLFWTQQERIVGFRNFDAIYDTRIVENGTDYLPLTGNPQDFSTLNYEVDGKAYPLDHYLETFFVAGFLVASGDSILIERYRLGHSETSRWVSFSVAKSVTSLLIGAAIRDGYIESVDEEVTDYLPRLKGGSYEGTTIRHLLQMASGVAWNESYTDPASDVALAAGLNGLALVNYLGKLPRAADPGTRFNYNTGETNLAGAVLRAAIGNNAASYLAAKVWRPLMEHPATWSINSDVELGGCCIHATLRDYARIGLFAARDGVLPDGTRTLPEGWMRESTRGSPSYPGYGYLWWLWGDGRYAAHGIFGQLIWIDPGNDLVIVTQSAAPAATSPRQFVHRNALVDAVRRHVGSMD